MIQTAAISFSLLFHSLGIFGATTTIQSYICEPPAGPSITSPLNNSVVAATTPFTLSGTGTPSSTIFIASDSIDMVEVTTDQHGKYSADLTVKQGVHHLSVRSTNPCGSATGASISVNAQSSSSAPDTASASTVRRASNQSAGATVAPHVSDTTTPADQQPTSPTTSDQQQASHGIQLSVTTPANNSETTDSSVVIKGDTNSPTTQTIKIGSTTVASTQVASSHSGLSVPLSVGKNTLTITATDGKRNASVVLTVIRNAPAQPQAWYKTDTGKTVVHVAAVGGVSFLFVLFMVGLFLL